MSLDGHKYTFKGKGEFTLVETQDATFTLQGRMEQAQDSDGVQAPGTVFTSIVARQGGMTMMGGASERRVEFQVNVMEGGLDVLVDGNALDFSGSEIPEHDFQ